MPGGISGFFGADDPLEQAGAAALVVYAVQLILFVLVSSMLSGIIALAAVRSQLAHRVRTQGTAEAGPPVLAGIWPRWVCSSRSRWCC